LKSANRKLDGEVRRSMRKSLRADVLPVAKRMAPHESGQLARKTTLGVTTRGAYLQQKTPYAAITEFGGTRRDEIRPKSAKALLTPYGMRALVSKPRVYTGSGRLREAAYRTQPIVEEQTLHAVLATYSGSFEVKRG
jgi:hypothetical protein